MNKRLIWYSDKHALKIIKDGDNLQVLHHGESLISCHRKEEKKMNVLKDMVNTIINNHNKLKIDYRKYFRKGA